MKRPYKKLAVGTLFAAVAGYIAGVLTAPRPGAETREELKTMWQNGEKQLKELHTELSDLLTQAKQQSAKLKGEAQAKYKEVVETAQKAKEKARMLLTSIHEGDTEDKDLQAAINDAKQAAEHLRAYFTKG